jgi:hypothetical protein
MDKERTQLKAKFLYLISLVEDKDQDSVIEVLESTEDLLPDGKLKDKIQKALRRRKKYYDKADNAISDILDTPLNDNDRKIILDCLDDVTDGISGVRSVIKISVTRQEGGRVTDGGDRFVIL